MPKLDAAMMQLGKKCHFVYDLKVIIIMKKDTKYEDFSLSVLLKLVGTPIHAAATGRVIYAGKLRGYGNVIKIRHDNEHYMHIKKDFIEVSDGVHGLNRGK